MRDDPRRDELNRLWRRPWLNATERAWLETVSTRGDLFSNKLARLILVMHSGSDGFRKPRPRRDPPSLPDMPSAAPDQDRPAAGSDASLAEVYTAEAEGEGVQSTNPFDLAGGKGEGAAAEN